jgi:hypothetical protein
LSECSAVLLQSPVTFGAASGEVDEGEVAPPHFSRLSSHPSRCSRSLPGRASRRSVVNYQGPFAPQLLVPRSLTFSLTRQVQPIQPSLSPVFDNVQLLTSLTRLRRTLLLLPRLRSSLQVLFFAFLLISALSCLPFPLTNPTLSMSTKRNRSPDLEKQSKPPSKRRTADVSLLPNNPLRFKGWNEPSDTVQIATWNVQGLVSCTAVKNAVRSQFHRLSVAFFFSLSSLY